MFYKLNLDYGFRKHKTALCLPAHSSIAKMVTIGVADACLRNPNVTIRY